MAAVADALTRYVHPAGCSFMHRPRYLELGVGCLVVSGIIYIFMRRLNPSWERTVCWLLYMTILVVGLGFLFFYGFEQLCPG